MTTTNTSYMSGLVDDYLIHCEARGLSPRTLDGTYRYSLRSVFLPWCQENGIDDPALLDQKAFDRLTTSLLRRGSERGKPISRFTAATYIRPIRQLVTWAAREGEAVTGKPQLPRCELTPVDPLSRAEIERLEAVVPTERDKLIIRILGDCGPRLTELITLTPNAILRSGRQTHLRVLGKRGRIRDVPVPPTVGRRLWRYVESRPSSPSGRLFTTLRRGNTGDYEAITGHGVEQVLAGASARAKFRRVGPHLMRHSWITEMARQGMSPMQLSILAGTSIEVIMKHYIHLTKDDAYNAMLRALVAPHSS